MKRNESSPLREILAAQDTIEQLNALTEPEKHGLDPMLNQLHMRSLASTKETWDHSFQVLEQGISIAQEMGITPTLVLKTALLFHDIGGGSRSITMSMWGHVSPGRSSQGTGTADGK